MDVFLDYLTLQPGGITDDVKSLQCALESFQEAVITHPVGYQVAQPGHPLAAIVISAGKSDGLGAAVLHVYELGYIRQTGPGINHIGSLVTLEE